MTNLAIRQGLEVRLKQLSPDFKTAWENKVFEPEAGTPYQEVYFLFAKPENPTMGDGHYRQRGIMQVTLRYPLNTGARAASERAELLQDSFKRGLSVVAQNVTTRVEETPEISEGRNIDGNYVIVVRIRFFADFYYPVMPEPNQELRWAGEDW